MSDLSRQKLRIARILLDTSVLHQLLFLPANMHIRAEHIDPMRNSLALFVESDDLPECEAGQIPPEIWLSLIGWQTEDRGVWYRTELRFPDSVQRLKEQESEQP